MPDQFRTTLSFAVHAFVGLIVSWAIAHGIDIGPHYSALAETALLAVVVAAYAALTHWLAARTGTTFLASAARWASKVLTLGTGALVPATPVKPVPENAKALIAQAKTTGDTPVA